MTNSLVAYLRLAALIVLTLGMIPVQSCLVAFGHPRWKNFGRGYWRLVVRALGIRIRVHGQPPETGPILVVANHASYWDVFILGSLLAGSFVAKSEVANWPVVGFVTKLGRTVFIDRSRRGSAREKSVVRERLEEGGVLMLFPEGTSNDGNRVLPFKSTLFSVVEEGFTGADGQSHAIPVQPVSVAYSGLDGLPMQRAFRSYYAWYGDMTLPGHVMAALGLGNLTVDVVFHSQVSVADFGNRKMLSNHCHKVIEKGLVQALTGRLESAG